MLATSGLFSGKPLTTGATGKPAETRTALDNASQAVGTQAMQALDATRIVIAHRLSTIRSADRIIVIDAGVAVESGTYDELLALDGVFAALVKRQVS